MFSGNIMDAKIISGPSMELLSKYITNTDADVIHLECSSPRDVDNLFRELLTILEMNKNRLTRSERSWEGRKILV
jgi:hypothetical protein